MTVKEIMQLESGNQTNIILLREGIFWKAYEKSAFAFFHEVHPYKPIRKWVQAVKEHVVSLGFPIASASTVLKGKTILLQQEDRLVVSTSTIDQEEFEQWKLAIPATLPSVTNAVVAEQSVTLSAPIPIVAATKPSCYEEIADSIRGFNLESKTPVECMLFLMELKRKLAENLKF